MNRFLSVFLLSCLLPVSALAQVECMPVEPKINIKISQRPVVYNNSLSRFEFPHYAKIEKRMTLGLTRVEMDTKPSFSYQVQKLKKGACAFLTEINFEIGYSKLNVYIDKQYKPGSCAYRVLKEHEDYHVEVARQALKFFAPGIRVRLNKMKEKLSVSYGLTPHIAEIKIKNQFKQLFESDIMPILNHINAKINEKNAAIDTPESYAQTRALCQDW